jgi:exodeoxyribonuclease VII large subunit
MDRMQQNQTIHGKRMLTVSALNKYIRDLFVNDYLLHNVWVKGEVSNFKLHSSGHMYFTLKDELGVIRCVMFRTYNMGLKVIPKNGIKVLLRGTVSVFERDGQYQVYVEELIEDGVGSLHVAFEQLKEQLKKEGLFDAKLKKKLPLLPQKIGVITSKTGSVIKDIVHVLERRFYNSSIYVYPVKVQGKESAKEIADAISKLNLYHLVEVIIMARGGGTIEELWAFNEEVVARAIFHSSIPIISAIGHETDYTISDFVADVRAPTPSAAAELVMPQKLELRNKIDNLTHRFIYAFQKHLQQQDGRLRHLERTLMRMQPAERINQERIKLDFYKRDLMRHMKHVLETRQSMFLNYVDQLHAYSPLQILKRGYAIAVKNGDNQIIKSITDVQLEEAIEIIVNDGKIHGVVKKVEEVSHAKKEKKL